MSGRILGSRNRTTVLQLERKARGYLQCTSCQQDLPLFEFTRNSRSSTGYGAYCRACHRNKSKLRLWGMTSVEYDQRMAEGCAICGAPAHGMDHNHTTGALRSPLCNQCNTALGLMKDDPDRLRAAADYLENHRG